MQVNMRKEARRTERAAYSLLWKDGAQTSRSDQVESIDISPSGVALRCSAELPPGTVVYIKAHNGQLTGYCSVRNCVPVERGFRVGLEFHQETKSTATSADEEVDYYEYLQISPKAEFATIQRIYHFMASRLHPDNPLTGDPERFLLLNRAYNTLSDPEQRAVYDANYRKPEVIHNPIFDTSEFLNGLEGEANRRLGILSLLYHSRRTNAQHPGVSMFDIEKRMGYPREYLEFATWYLKSKGLIGMADNAELTLLAAGVDYVEENASRQPILQKLLNSGPKTTTGPITSKRATRGPDGEPLALGPGDVDPDSNNGHQ